VFRVSEVSPNVVSAFIPAIQAPFKNAAFALYSVKKLSTEETHRFHKYQTGIFSLCWHLEEQPLTTDP
jgi:hypothetical protein